jgi:hypothetical protein
MQLRCAEQHAQHAGVHFGENLRRDGRGAEHKTF